tara:strand:- start:324 stop:515 length:192 start_codon:yes stop_codon:yes gene_type:complete
VPELLTTSQVAKIARVTPRTIRNWARSGKLKFSRSPGGHRRFRREDVREVLSKIKDPEDGIRY